MLIVFQISIENAGFALFLGALEMVTLFVMQLGALLRPIVCP